MPISVDDLAVLNEWSNGAIQRANHHASQVVDCILPIVGGVVYCANPNSIAKRNNSEPTSGNIIWFRSKATDRTYAIAYNHSTRKIEIRDRNQQGAVLHVFDNNTLLVDYLSIFSAL